MNGALFVKRLEITECFRLGKRAGERYHQLILQKCFSLNGIILSHLQVIFFHIKTHLILVKKDKCALIKSCIIDRSIHLMIPFPNIEID